MQVSNAGAVGCSYRARCRVADGQVQSFLTDSMQWYIIVNGMWLGTILIEDIADQRKG